VDELWATVHPMAERKGLALEVRIDGPARLRTDGQKLSQILLNLLSNAVKFTEHGAITLDVRDQPGQVSFAVTDTVIGMTSEQQVRAFQPFEQADASTTRRYGGTGLGLAISERFCTLLGGRLTVTRAVDRGSTFSLALPHR
jgi:signal transduction histidine kinase